MRCSLGSVLQFSRCFWNQAKKYKQGEHKKLKRLRGRCDPYTHMQSSHGREQQIFGPLRLSRPPAYKWVRESILRKSCFLSDIALGGGRPGNSLGTTVTLLGTPFGFSRECITGAIAGYIYRISYGDIQMWIFFPFHMHKKSRKS